MLTIIDNKELRCVIKLSGRAIRGFLSGADPAGFKGEARMAIALFKADPAAFSDDKLVTYGKGILKAVDYPVRIEIRGATREGAGQMVAKGIWGPARGVAASEIARQCRRLGFGLHLKLAGTSSIEFNVEGVDKSLPIHFLQGAFEEVLKEMKYRPGPGIDSSRSKTIIAADGDGTIYDGPRVGFLPALAESPVREPLCDYLRAGGIFMLVSGNDLDRSFKRLVDALPRQVYCRVLVAANGGSELVCVDSRGAPKPVSGYRKQALEFARNKSSRRPLDIVYIGDDGSREGNDYPAFKAVGFKRSILVARRFLADYDPALKAGYIGGLLQGTRRYLKSYLSHCQ
ncbi:MAG: hypothetical protein KGI24_02730 [Candidatus Omnitrophica bacterium]|nr:hypothetical protein [Candidatus Omnitrophota bacterium]MDE2214255.1 hypothetical protein [Candidatus Omnitrophota bacterium]MDE2231292.1 hypothetical protein [Candidatus Omnitrophota bacterium]